MKLLMEIRAGEGGLDSKLLMKDQSNIYMKFAQRMGASVIVENRGSL